jgi:hypothetical protein
MLTKADEDLFINWVEQMEAPKEEAKESSDTVWSVGAVQKNTIKRNIR